MGKRRLQLKERFERFVSLAFAQRVLVYDEAAARTYGEVMGLRKEMGRPMSVPESDNLPQSRARQNSPPVTCGTPTRSCRLGRQKERPDP